MTDIGYEGDRFKLEKEIRAQLNGDDEYLLLDVLNDVYYKYENISAAIANRQVRAEVKAEIAAIVGDTMDELLGVYILHEYEENDITVEEAVERGLFKKAERDIETFHAEEAIATETLVSRALDNEITFGVQLGRDLPMEYINRYISEQMSITAIYHHMVVFRSMCRDFGWNWRFNKTHIIGEDPTNPDLRRVTWPKPNQMGEP